MLYMDHPYVFDNLLSIQESTHFSLVTDFHGDKRQERLFQENIIDIRANKAGWLNFEECLRFLETLSRSQVKEKEREKAEKVEEDLERWSRRQTADKWVGPRDPATRLIKVWDACRSVLN